VRAARPARQGRQRELECAVAAAAIRLLGPVEPVQLVEHGLVDVEHGRLVLACHHRRQGGEHRELVVGVVAQLVELGLVGRWLVAVALGLAQAVEAGVGELYRVLAAEPASISPHPAARNPDRNLAAGQATASACWTSASASSWNCVRYSSA
jgi:hypothetical protein